MISVLYFIRKINALYINNTNNISINGNIIDECIVLDPSILILDGWCNVFHQSTEYFIIGIFIAPMTIIKDEILLDNASALTNLMQTI